MKKSKLQFQFINVSDEMETYIVTIYAKFEHADEVANYYTGIQSLYQEASGFISRKVYRAKTGAMVRAVLETYSKDELKGNPEEAHAQGEHFVIIEEWQSIQDRINFGRSLSKEHHMKVVPYILPEHSHEFYKNI